MISTTLNTRAQFKAQRAGFKSESFNRVKIAGSSSRAYIEKALLSKYNEAGSDTLKGLEIQNEVIKTALNLGLVRLADSLITLT